VILQEVDGGTDRACRGDDVDDDSEDYFKVHWSTLALEDCQDHCARDAECTGIEYGSYLERCEVWTKKIQASVPAAGYVCLGVAKDNSNRALLRGTDNDTPKG